MTWTYLQINHIKPQMISLWSGIVQSSPFDTPNRPLCYVEDLPKGNTGRKQWRFWCLIQHQFPPRLSLEIRVVLLDTRYQPPRHWLFGEPDLLSFSSFFHPENHKETFLSILSGVEGFWVQFFLSGSREKKQISFSDVYQHGLHQIPNYKQYHW